jgi:hypothetical protein
MPYTRWSSTFTPLKTHQFEIDTHLKLSDAFLENAPEPLHSWLHTHTYCSRISRHYILCSDDARFFNHSDTPNTESREVHGEDEVITVAKRDIQPGEELTDDYRTFEANFVDL